MHSMALHILHLLILKPLIRISLLVHTRHNTSSLRNARALSSKWCRWKPSHRLASLVHFVVQFVDLLKSEALGLVDEEVDEADTQEAAAEPDEEDLGLEVGVAGTVVHQVGGGVGDGPVEKPCGL